MKFGVWQCFTLTSSDILLRVAGFLPKLRKNWSSYPMAKTMGSWNPLPKPKGLICSWGTVWQMPLFSRWTATSMCWARTAIRFGLRSPAWSTEVLQMRVVDGWFGEFFISHGVCCHICAVYCTHFISFICYLAYLIIWFCKDIIPMKTSTWIWNLEFSVADLWPAVMWHKVWRALSASLWRHARNLENLQQRHGESKVLPRWGLQDYIEG